MILGLDFSDPIVLIVTLVLVFLAIDLIATGGGMTGGMMSGMTGMTGMKGTPWGWVLAALLAVLVILLILSGT